MKKKQELVLQNIHASVETKEILHGVTLRVCVGEVHAVMGPNGGGKSTLASVLLGHPFYRTVRKKGVRQQILLNGKNILPLPPEKRAAAGLFLAFQSPVAIAGVTVNNLLRTSYRSIYGPKNGHVNVQNPALRHPMKIGEKTIAEFTATVKSYAEKLSLDPVLLQRGIHDGFSGGEKKKIEMLQALVLQPKYAVFDEIDTGLDVDALKAVAYGIDQLRKSGTGVIIITHYQRILRYVKPDSVHILVGGRIVKTGTAALAKKIETSGYKTYLAQA